MAAYSVIFVLVIILRAIMVSKILVSSLIDLPVSVMMVFLLGMGYSRSIVAPFVTKSTVLPNLT